ncbi:polysaccharide biosynthesis/export family protein [Vibrio algicola]|uniref:Polysaccharide export protein n=1 Tax=Vibrio algicola TaxID=2662262 RepID=A0A5Q0THP9_9VIBR|nr:polysaccharide biosynthesis/export family protein [Vibrio algicola]
MKNITSVLLTFFVFVLVSTNVSADSKTNQQANENPYVISMGDQIQISVYNEADLSMSLLVDETGSVMYPLIGKVQLTGKTPNQVSIDIRDRLKDGYMKRPMVTVSITEFSPIYVSGEVKTPGSYDYQPGFTLEKTIAVAGGFTDRADRDDISIRRADGQLLKDVENTQPVYPGDIVIIEQSFF